MARPRKFTPKQFKKAWDDYFAWCDANPWYKHEAIKSGERAGEIIKIPIERPYTEIGFCAFHSLGKNYLQQMDDSLSKEDLTHEEEQLSVILTRARARCWTQKFEGATVGVFRENIIARELGLWEKMQSDHTNKGEAFGDITVSIKYPNEKE